MLECRTAMLLMLYSNAQIGERIQKIWARGEAARYCWPQKTLNNFIYYILLSNEKNFSVYQL